MTSTPAPQQPRSVSELEGVVDFDDGEHFPELENRAGDARSLNFVLEFDQDNAWCKFDATLSDIAALLAKDNADKHNTRTRWINIWGPQRQEEIINKLSKKYGFSLRLEALMRSAPRRAAEMSDYNSSVQSSKLSGRPGSTHSVRNYLSRRSNDEEKSLSSAVLRNNDDFDVVRDIGHYDIVSNIWHWSSIDMGPQHYCIGYNTLHEPPKDKIHNFDQDLPSGIRLWNWLILCDDKTVISISEDTSTQGFISNVDSKGKRIGDNFDRRVLRKNLLNIFRQLTHVHSTHQKSAINLIQIRVKPETTTTAQQPQFEDAPGQLFYYLFDDWYSTYRILAKEDRGLYRIKLKALRESIRWRASLNHVDQLDHVGRQLATLKRLYQSYDLIIGRILDKQRSPPEDLQEHYSRPIGGEQVVDQNASGDGIYLASAARIRFERLQDRIHLYALSELEECIEIKDSLITMNMNLITIKESDSVERLTRITILLAKATLLFLPVSLMTAYFSITVKDLDLTIQAYWISFAVIFFLSFIALYIFGKISGTVEGDLVYQNFWELVKGDMWKRMLRPKSD